VLIGIGTLAFLLWKPHIEGRNAHATLFEIYFNDPFLACAYIASIPIFVALYQAFKALAYVRQNKTFSPAAVQTMRTIKYCATAMAGFVVAGEAALFIVQRGKEDIAGGVVMGLVLIFVSAVIANAAAMFERVLQAGVDMKAENDLSRLSSPR